MLPHGQKIICFLQGKRIDDHSLGMTTLLLLFLGYGHVHANQNIKSFSGSCSRIALHVWHSFTNSFLSCCELFFCQTFFLKIAHGVKLLFYALKEEWREVKLKKVAFPSSLIYFPLSTIHEVVGETVLPNSFSKIAQLHQ